MRGLILSLAIFMASIAHAQDWSGSGEVDYTALAFAQQLTSVTHGSKPDAQIIRAIFDSAQMTVVDSRGQMSWVRGQGLKVDEWNLEALRNSYKNGVGLTLDHMLSILYLTADGVKKKMPAEAKIDPKFRKIFLADLKRMTELPEEDMTGLRFMSHFIVLVGLNSERPYDLLNENVPGNVRLDPVQSFLLLHRMAAELHVFARKYKQLPSPSLKLNQTKSMIAMNAGCNMTEIEGLIMDAAATGSGMILGGAQFFKGALELLADAKYLNDLSVTKYAEMSLVANVVSNYLKLLITMSAFEAELSQVPRPLIRTKNKIAGANGEVRGKFWLDVGNTQYVNCIRPALNVFGLDFSVPQSGALAGVRAEWAINSRVGADNDVIQTYDVDPLRQVTDADGNSSIKIQGKPQKKDLTGKKLLKVDRYVPVNVAVNLKNNNMGQDLIDLAGGAGGIAAMWSLPTELLNRIPFLFNKTINVKITDWKELEGDHFQIVGNYTGLDIRDPWDAFKRNITDRVLIDLEVKVLSTGTVDAKVISFEDDQTSYKHEYESTFYAGEGCKVTRSPVGRYEVYTQLPSKTSVEGFAIGNLVKVIFNAQGFVQLNGWRYKEEFPSCKLNDVEPTIGDSYKLYLDFDSSELNKIGQTIRRDRRDSNGEGWIFDITYVE